MRKLSLPDAISVRTYLYVRTKDAPWKRPYPMRIRHVQFTYQNTYPGTMESTLIYVYRLYLSVGERTFVRWKSEEDVGSYMNIMKSWDSGRYARSV